jgi:acyl-CoA thioesterase FadM
VRSDGGIWRRTGIWDAVKEVKGVVYAYSVTIRYRRELKPFQKFDVVSKIVGWDDRNMFIEQRIVVGGFVHAVATSKMVMAKGTFTAVLEALGHMDPSPPLPKDILSWTEVCAVF